VVRPLTTPIDDQHQKALRTVHLNRARPTVSHPRVVPKSGRDRLHSG